MLFFFFNQCLIFFSHCVILNAIRELILFFQKGFWFFLPHGVILNLIQDLTFIFSKSFWFFFFLFLPYFYFFIKIIITSLRGRNQLEVRSPRFWIWVIYSGYIFPYDSGSPLPVSPRRSGAKLGRFAWGNPLLLGHGLRRCLKNLPASEIEVSSVSCEQIRVEIFF